VGRCSQAIKLIVEFRKTRVVGEQMQARGGGGEEEEEGWNGLLKGQSKGQGKAERAGLFLLFSYTAAEAWGLGRKLC
jgi:hypothetical protein